MVCLPLDYISGFLFGLNADRVKPELRERVLRYQRECYKVLAEAFQDGRLTTDSDVLEASTAYGQQVADHILAWSKTDNYAQTRSFTKYTVNNEPGRWQPTPPAFIEAVEPHWREIRALTLDSASQFTPDPPVPFSTEKTSQFYKLASEVYTAVDSNKEEKMEIANFWDCNPYVMHQQGHLMMATKKITPGGHWMFELSLP